MLTPCISTHSTLIFQIGVLLSIYGQRKMFDIVLDPDLKRDGSGYGNVEAS
jgi:hypothetical protein